MCICYKKKKGLCDFSYLIGYRIIAFEVWFMISVRERVRYDGDFVGREK